MITKQIEISTKGNCDIIDITAQIEAELSDTKIHEGLISIFVVGSTVGISTIEFESGLLSDLKNMLDRIIPENNQYNHNSRWGDNNGHSHIRASLFSTSIVIPYINKKLALGTWQQIILVDFDNRPRSRIIIIQIIGD